MWTIINYVWFFFRIFPDYMNKVHPTLVPFLLPVWHMTITGSDYLNLAAVVERLLVRIVKKQAWKFSTSKCELSFIQFNHDLPNFIKLYPILSSFIQFIKISFLMGFTKRSQTCAIGGRTLFLSEKETNCMHQKSWRAEKSELYTWYYLCTYHTH